MKAIPRAALWAAMTFLLCMLVAAAVSVYGFDEYERAWGRGGSFQVLSWVAVAASLAVGLCAALGFRLAGGSVQRRPRLAGTAVGLAGSALVVILAALGHLRGQLAIDSCLDLGGRWDYDRKVCDQGQP